MRVIYMMRIVLVSIVIHWEAKNLQTRRQECHWLLLKFSQRKRDDNYNDNDKTTCNKNTWQYSKEKEKETYALRRLLLPFKMTSTPPFPAEAMTAFWLPKSTPTTLIIEFYFLFISFVAICKV